MKRIFSVLISIVLLTACDRGLTERERECLDRTGSAEHCIRSANRHVVHHYEPRQHVNYYGHPEHGYWNNGVYTFHDPRSSYATSTEAFLLGAGLGGLAAYKMSDMGSRDSWEDRNPSGWKERKSYYGKDGKKITKAEYDRRKRQSAADKAKNKPIVKKTVPPKKPVVKPTVVKKPVVAKKPVVKKTDPSLYKKNFNTKNTTKNSWQSGKTSNNWNKSKPSKPKSSYKPKPKPYKKK